MHKLFIAVAVLLAASAGHATAHGCNGIIRRNTLPPDWPALLPLVQNDFFDKHDIRLIRTMEVGEWIVIEADNAEPTDDPPYIFVRGRHRKPQFVWEFEGIDPDLTNLALANAPGIPTALARCFAWSVSHRD